MEITEKGLWLETIEVFQRNLKPCLAYMGTMLAIVAAQEFISTNSSLSVAEAFAAAMLAIPAHLTVLKNKSGFESMGDATSSRLLMPFVFRGIGLGMFAAIPFVIAIVALLAAGMPELTAIFASGAILLVSSVGIFAKWGTMLPAVLARDDKTLARAGQRGSLIMSYALPRLLLCFGLLTIIEIGIFTGYSTMGNGDGSFFPATGGFDFVLLAITIMGVLFGAFQIVMTAVILSRSYLRAEGKTAVV